MKWIIQPLIDPVLDFINEGMFLNGFYNTFYIEKILGISDDTLAVMQMLILGFGTFLLTLKLLVKLLNIYIFGVDGDNTVSPIEYLKSFCKGIIIMATFTVAYGWLGEVLKDFTEQILAIMGEVRWVNFATVGPGLGSIFLLVYCIFVVILYINFMLNGIRMLFLRLAIPIACVGLIDNDNGIYAIFIKKIFQTGVTVCVQMILAQLSLIPMRSENPVDNFFLPIILGIAILSYSLKITTDLNEIFLTGAASGAGQKISSIGRGVQSMVGMFKK